MPVFGAMNRAQPPLHHQQPQHANHTTPNHSPERENAANDTNNNTRCTDTDTDTDHRHHVYLPSITTVSTTASSRALSAGAGEEAKMKNEEQMKHDERMQRLATQRSLQQLHALLGRQPSPSPTGHRPAQSAFSQATTSTAASLGRNPGSVSLKPMLSTSFSATGSISFDHLRSMPPLPPASTATTRSVSVAPSPAGSPLPSPSSTPVDIKHGLAATFAHIRASPVRTPLSSSSSSLSSSFSSSHSLSFSASMAPTPVSMNGSMMLPSPLSSTSVFSPASFSSATGSMDDEPSPYPSPYASPPRSSLHSNLSTPSSASSMSSRYRHPHSTSTPSFASPSPFLVPNVDISPWLSQAATVITEQSNTSQSLHSLLSLLLTQSGGDEVKLCRYNSSLNRWQIDGSCLGPNYQVPVPRTPDPHAMLYDSTVQSDVPTSIFELILTTRSIMPLTQSDILDSSDFSHDPYFTSCHSLAQSFLALPIIQHGKLEAILFFASNTSSEAFSLAHIAFIQIVGAQLIGLLPAMEQSVSAISALSSATVIENQSKEIEQLKREMTELRIQFSLARTTTPPVSGTVTPERVSGSHSRLSTHRLSHSRSHSHSHPHFHSHPQSPSQSQSIPVLIDDEQQAVAIPAPTPVRRSLYSEWAMPSTAPLTLPSTPLQSSPATSMQPILRQLNAIEASMNEEFLHAGLDRAQLSSLAALTQSSHHNTPQISPLPPSSPSAICPSNDSPSPSARRLSH